MNKRLAAVGAACALVLGITGCTSLGGNPNETKYLQAAHQQLDDPSDMTDAQLKIIGKDFCRFMDEDGDVNLAFADTSKLNGFSAHDVAVGAAFGVNDYCPKYYKQIVEQDAGN